MRGPYRSVAASMVAVLLMLTLVACSDDKPEEPARPLDTTPAPGSFVVSDEATGFAVSIPDTWVKLPTSLGDFDAAADAVRAQAAPEVAAAVATGLDQLKSAVRGGVAMVAIDPRTGAGTTLVTLDDNDQTPEEVAVGTANELIATGVTDVSREKITIDGVEAVRQRFKAPVSTETGPITVSKSQIYVVRRGELFILSLIGETPETDSIGTSLKLA